MKHKEMEDFLNENTPDWLLVHVTPEGIIEADVQYTFWLSPEATEDGPHSALGQLRGVVAGGLGKEALRKFVIEVMKRGTDPKASKDMALMAQWAEDILVNNTALLWD